MFMKHEKLIQKLRSGNKPVLILICGMPGTRKSSTAVMLGGLLGFSSVIGMDEVRDIMQVYDKNPVVQSKSHYCWEFFGKFDKENFTKGYYAHSRALKKGLLAPLNKNLSLGENTIAEGVHLAPSLYSGRHTRYIINARVFHFVLTSGDFKHHQKLLSKKFGRRHNLQKPWSENKIKKIETIQEILADEAKKYNAIIIPSKNPGKNCREIIKWLNKNLNK